MNNRVRPIPHHQPMQAVHIGQIAFENLAPFNRRLPLIDSDNLISAFFEQYSRSMPDEAGCSSD